MCYEVMVKKRLRLLTINGYLHNGNKTPHDNCSKNIFFFFEVPAAADLKGILAVHLQNANVCEKKGPELESV